MGWRGVSIDNVFIGDFFFVAAFGLVITAQWEMSLGNGFAYTVFSAFGKPRSLDLLDNRQVRNR